MTIRLVFTGRKHRLMIEWTGEKWDDEYIKELMDGDSAYVNYLAGWFAWKLEEENETGRGRRGTHKEEDGTASWF